jgi:hypothetical protein
MGRSPQKMMAQVPWIQVVFAAWGLQGDVGENSPGSNTSITAALEYPSGTYQQITFSGSATGTITSGSNITSDRINNPPPKGAAFWIRAWASCSAGASYHYGINVNTALGESCNCATTVTDVTMGGAITNVGNFSFRPLAIIGPTNMPSVGIFGDSRNVGIYDAYANGTYDIGEIGRSIGLKLPYISVGATGDSAAVYNSNHAKRATVLPWLSHFICEYGVNDLADGNSAATTEANLQTLWASLGKPHRTYQSTMPPISTSTDSWATTANQTTDATNNPKIVTVNTWIRGVPQGVAGYFEVSDAVEDIRGNGKWKAPGYTPDGVHETSTASLAIQTAKGIRPERLHF